MPDWLTHTLAGWITGKTTKIDIGLVVIGSLLPDLVKIHLAFIWLGIDHYRLFDPFHTPAGVLLIAGIIALIFQKPRNAFFLLSVGIATHFILDFFLVHVSGGIRLFFPLSWDEYQIYLIYSDDYTITILALAAALLIFSIYWYRDKQKRMKHV